MIAHGLSPDPNVAKWPLHSCTSALLHWPGPATIFRVRAKFDPWRANWTGWLPWVAVQQTDRPGSNSESGAIGGLQLRNSGLHSRPTIRFQEAQRAPGSEPFTTDYTDLAPPVTRLQTGVWIPVTPHIWTFLSFSPHFRSMLFWCHCILYTVATAGGLAVALLGSFLA